jgi:predicted amidohydrolase
VGSSARRPVEKRNWSCCQSEQSSKPYMLSLHLLTWPARYHLNGYLPGDPAYIAQTSLCREYLEGYSQLACELGVCIVPGTFVERHPATPGPPLLGSNILKDAQGEFQLFNTAYFISNDGSILGSYRKKNLWHTERTHQSRGQAEHAAIDTPVGRVGLLACWDLAFPEAFRDLARDGADIIIVPTCWTLDESCRFGTELNPDYESLFLNSLITTRCFENSCAVVFANAGGPSDVYLGLSQVAVPFVGPVDFMKGSPEGLLLADIDRNVLKESEINYKVREDMTGAEWHYKN